jgi:CelD/BcsL family acetyltransferase involved in cellulose biosynthesis
LKIHILKPLELDSGQLGIWNSILHSDETLASPFLCPEFISAVGHVCEKVRVAVIEQGGRPVAFFPYENHSGLGKPVGRELSDYHGIVGDLPDCLLLRSFLERCGLKSWQFDHAPASQNALQEYSWETDFSPVISLKHGFDDYARQCKDARTKQRHFRRLERDFGPVRFVLDCRDCGVFEKMMTWKSQQYLKTGKEDLTQDPVKMAILRKIFECRSQHFSGLLSALFAGDRLIAGHFGMRFKNIWHWWFPSYDPAEEVSNYSPGILLLLAMAKEGPNQGIDTIDLGKGDSFYKMRLMNDKRELIVGCLDKGGMKDRAKRFLLRKRKCFGKSALGMQIKSTLQRNITSEQS